MRTALLARSTPAPITMPRAPQHPAAWAPIGAVIGLAIAKAIDVAIAGPGLLAAFGI